MNAMNLRILLPLLAITAAPLCAQTSPPPRHPDHVISVDMDGGGKQQLVELYTRYIPEDSLHYETAWLRLNDKELWRLPDSLGGPYKIDVSAVAAHKTDRHQQIAIACTYESDFMEHWVVSWTGSNYHTERVKAWGPLQWKGDGTFISEDWFGFCRVRRLWNYDLATGQASLATVDSSQLAERLKLTTRKSLKLTENRGRGKTTVLKRRSYIVIDAIDTRGANTETTPVWGDAWLRVRTDNGKIGWARVAEVNAAVQLPWAG